MLLSLVLRSTKEICLKPLSQKARYPWLPQRYHFATTPQMNPKLDYYRILSIPEASSQSQIKSKFYELAKKYHPDSGAGNQDKFKQINEAHTVLSNERLRKEYDALRRRENIGVDGQQHEQQSQRSSYKHSQSQWAQYRRGKSFSHNPYSSNYYGNPHSDVYEMLRERERMRRRDDDDLRDLFEAISRRETQDLRREEKHREMAHIIKQMERKHRAYQDRLFNSTILGRMLFAIWGILKRSTSWLLSYFRGMK